MSDIVLSAATRNSLLAAQNTANLLSTTQGRLATGKKVASALDNPLNFFTGQSLDSRASDLSNLLDSISNGVQTIQSANTGVTNIQKLVDSAKSVGNQALATTVTTTGTATTAFPAVTADVTVKFDVDGVQKTAALKAAVVGPPAVPADNIDTTITKLNTAAGSNVFGKDATGTKLTVNGTGKIEIHDTGSLTALGFAAVGTDVAATSYIDESNSSTDLKVLGLDTRANLATQYNGLLTQIDQLAKDASYNGVNLISSAGSNNKLHIQFNADNTSSIDIQGVDATSSGLGLASVASSVAGSFSSNTGVQSTLDTLTTATSKLRSYASSLGSNLGVVQNRQDFTKNLVNVLQTGSANLTNADLNEEAANSQALSTRQSLAISSLSLANQAQQSVLQLLR